MPDYPGNKKRMFQGIMLPGSTIKPRIVSGSVSLGVGDHQWFYYATKPDGMIYKLSEFSSGQTEFGWHHVALKLDDDMIMHEYGKEFSVWSFAANKVLSFRYPDIIYIFLGNGTSGTINAWFHMTFWREIDRS